MNRWSILAVLLLALHGQVKAQTPITAPPPVIVVYGQRLENHRNLTPFVRIVGVPSPNYRITGTNAYLAVSIGAGERPLPHFPPYNEPFTWQNVTDLHLQIGARTIPNPVPPSGTDFEYQVRFSATEFTDGESLPISLQGTIVLKTDSGYTETVTLSVDVTAQIYNKAALFADNDLEDHPLSQYSKCYNIVELAFQSLRHSILPVSTHNPSWGQTEVHEGFNFASAGWIYCHATGTADLGLVSDHLLTQECDLIFQSGDGATPHDMQGWREEAAGFAVPPLNFAFMDACNTAVKGTYVPEEPCGRIEESHAWAIACLTPISTYVGIDRSEMGWRVESLDVWRGPFHQAFWQAIEQGLTVHEARDAGMNAVFDLMDSEDQHTSDLFTNYGEFEQDREFQVPRDYVAVFGDYYTRLKNVYTGGDDLSDWYRTFP